MTEENTIIESGPVRANIMALPLFQRHLEETKNLSESSIAMYVQCIKRFLSGKPDIGSPSSYVTFLVSHAVKKRSYHYSRRSDRICSSAEIIIDPSARSWSPYTEFCTRAQSRSS